MEDLKRLIKVYGSTGDYVTLFVAIKGEDLAAKDLHTIVLNNLERDVRTMVSP